VDIENPIALHFIMQDELFFLKEDREKQDSLAPVMAIIEEETPVAVVTTEPKPDFTYTGKKAVCLSLYITPDRNLFMKSIYRHWKISLNAGI
jgi:hypothetical protein